MENERVQALMFYDKDNQLIGSVGIEDKSYSNPELVKIVHGAIMDVFSVEEAKRIAYYKLEHHYLVIDNELKKNNEEVIDMERDRQPATLPTPPLGKSPVNAPNQPISYAEQLKQSGLFELRERANLKLETIDRLVEVVKADIDVYQELGAVIDSLLLDIGIAVIREEDQSST